MAGPQQQGLPDWYKGYQQQSSANEDSGGLEGVTPPAMKFKEGDSHFRLMPPAEAIPQALAAAKAGQSADWSGGGRHPVCRMKVYFPTYGDGPAKGISLFGSKAVVSPATVFPNESQPIYGNDPAQDWLEKEGIRWMKADDLKKDPMKHALREALSYKDRTALQVVNLGVSQNGAPVYLQRGQGNVETYFVYGNDFDSIWVRPLFTEVIERGRQPFDPGWYGIHFGIFRKGTDRNTEYSNLRGLFGMPYGDASKNYGDPLIWDAQGQPDWPEIERLLMQVKPWKSIMHIATVEEVRQNLERVIKAVHEKFAPASVSVPQMPGGFVPPGGYAPPPPAAGLPPSNPAMPGGGPAMPPMAGQYPPYAGAPASAPPAPQYPPAGGPPAAPPSAPPAPPQYQQQPQQQPPQYQQPPAGGPPQYPQQQPQYPPQQYPQQQQYGAPPQYGSTVPATPPGTPPLSAPGQGVNPAGVDRAAAGAMPPVPPQYPPSTPGGPPIPPPPPTR